jgi:hypothetical protein
LASRIWRVLMDLSRTIYEATDPTVDPFKSLPHYINPHHLSEIGMGTPQVLMIEKYSQNMLLSTTSFDHILKLLKMVQTVRLDAVQWIKEAKEHCDILRGNHGWIWPYSGIAKPLEFPNLPLLEGQGSTFPKCLSFIPFTLVSLAVMCKSCLLHSSALFQALGPVVTSELCGCAMYSY